jgi:hypothetical protein
MDELNKKRIEPKKIKLTPLVDRSKMYDTLSFENETLPDTKNWLNENNHENNTQSIQQLESDQTN